MTRDHDMKRAVRARMRVTGERYTTARSALVAPDHSPAPPETSRSPGGLMSALQGELLGELDERGFALVRAFASQEELRSVTAIVDEVISATLAEKQEEDRRRRAAGETGPIDVWHPGQPGGIYRDITDHPDVAWILEHPALNEIAHVVTSSSATLRKVAAWVSLPGYGHQGLHPDVDGSSPPIGAWELVRFVLMLTPHRTEVGGFRAIPGAHRARPPFDDRVGSAMTPHPDEERVDADPGDVLVYSPHLWKSETFNGGLEPRSCLLIE